MSYSSEILADSPLAYWRLGEASGSGSTLVDSSGNGRNGTYVVAPTLGVTGLIGGDTDTAADFDGGTSGAHAVVATDTWMDVAAITVEAWIKRESSSGTGYIVSRDNNSANRDWRLFINNVTGRLDFAVWNTSGTVVTLSPTTVLAIDTTYHVVATYDGTTMRVYVDGVQVGTAAHTGNVRTLAQKICIGSFNEATSNRFTGVIDEVAYYASALSPTRIFAHYTAGASKWAKAVLALAPYGWWRLNPISGTTLVDASGNGRNGSINPSFDTTWNVASMVPGAPEGKALTFGTGSACVASGLSFSHTSITHFGTFKSTSSSRNRLLSSSGGTGQYLDASGTNLAVRIDTFTSASTTYASTGLFDGNPHFIVMIVGSDFYELWIDGTQVASGSHAKAPVTQTQVNFKESSSHPAGTYQEWGMFTRALSSTETTNLHNGWTGAEPPPEVTASLTGSGAFSAVVVPVVSVDAPLTGGSSLTVTARVLGPNLHPDPQYLLGDGDDTGWWFATATSSLPAGLPPGYTTGAYVEHDGANPTAGRGLVAFSPTPIAPGRTITIGAWVRAVPTEDWSGRAQVRLAMVSDTLNWEEYQPFMPPAVVVQDTEGWRWVEIAFAPDPAFLGVSIDFHAYLTGGVAGPPGGNVRTYVTGVEIRQEVSPAAPLAGSGSFTATVEGATAVVGALDGSGALTAVVEVVVPAVAAPLSGSGALTAGIEGIHAVAGSLAGSGALTAATEVPAAPQVAGALSGSGLLSGDIVVVEIVSVTAPLLGAGQLTVVTVLPNASTPTVRWRLRDTATGVEWTMPINPDSMSSPLPRRSLKFGYGWRRDGRVRTFAGPGEAAEWEWSGAIRTKEHYDRLVEWAEKSVAIDVTDHLGRTFRIFITEFNPIDRRSTPRTPWRLRYTMKARVLERVG